MVEARHMNKYLDRMRFKSLNRKQVVIVFIVIICSSAYLLLSTFPIVTFFSPQLSGYFAQSLLIFLIFYALVLLSPILQRICNFSYRPASWLKLHWIFGWVELSCAALLSAVAVWNWSALKLDNDQRLFLMIWYLSFLVGLPILFQRIKNTLGMDYIKIGIPSLIGAVGYAEISVLNLKRERQKGLQYLTKSLLILQKNLSQRKQCLKDLDGTIAAINTLSSFEQKIPYRELCALAGNLIKLPAINHIPEALHTFQGSKDVEWTQAFSKLPVKEQREKSTAFIEKYILPIALVVVTLLGILAENNRTQVIDFLKNLQWTQVIGIFIVFFLFYEFVSLLDKLLVLDVAYRDIKEMLTLQGDYSNRVLYSNEQSVNGL